MKTKYKHIHFVKTEQLWGGRPSYKCRNNRKKTLLGTVDFYDVWGKYAFATKDDMVFDESCLLDIVDFVKQLGQADAHL